MSFIRGVMHIATLGLVASNKEAQMKKEEDQRKSTPFMYPAYFSEAELRYYATKVAKPIKRLKVTVKNQFVYGEVITQSGLNSWEFTIDFNDHGTFTGRRWITYVENHDSQIPYTYAKRLDSVLAEHFATPEAVYINQKTSGPSKIYVSYSTINSRVQMVVRIASIGVDDVFANGTSQEYRLPPGSQTFVFTIGRKSYKRNVTIPSNGAPIHIFASYDGRAHITID